MRTFLMTLILSLTATAGAAGFNSLESLLSTEGETSTFPTSFVGTNSPILLDSTPTEQVAQGYCDIQNKKLLTFTSSPLDFPETGEAWVYNSNTRIFTKSQFDYSGYTGAHTRYILTSVTCGAQLPNCVSQP